MSQFKAAATVAATSSAFARGKLMKRIPTITNFENAVDKQHLIPPHILASSGDLGALESSIDAFCLSLKERGKDNSTLLHHAARARQLAIMKFLVEKEIDLDATDDSGNSALHLSVLACHVSGIHLLLKAGASSSLLNKEKNSPLHLAARELSGLTLEVCLEYPVDVYIKGPRNRAILHIISETDNIEACKIFKKYMDKKLLNPTLGKDIKDRLCFGDDDGFTPMHLAARKNSHKVLEQVFIYWLERGHTREDMFDLINEENSTPLHVAVDSGNYEVACLLLKYGAKACMLKEDMSPPLHLACSLGRLEIVKAMVEYRGIGILHKLDCYQRTPLHYSVLSIHSCSIISYIMSEGDNIDIDKQDSKGKTPLHLAISAGNMCSVKELLKRGANPFLKDNNGCNGLHVAVTHNRKSVIHELLETPNSNELITEINHNGYSPIHIGLKLGLGDIMLSLVSCILTHCSTQSFFIKDCHGNNYAHLAAASGNSKLLLEFLDLPNAHRLLIDINKQGETPLHCAAFKGQSHCIEILLNRGAMVHKCYKGTTPLMVACGNGYMDCAKILYKAHTFQIDWQDNSGDTALHHATRSCNPSMIQFVLDLPCKILQNDNAESFLDLVVENADENCALAVVNHKRWQECLDVVSPLSDAPMLKFIQKMPNIAKAVLDRCYKHVKNSSKGVNAEVYNFKYLFSLENQGSIGKNDIPVVPPLLRRKSMHQLKTADFDPETSHEIVNYKRSISKILLPLHSEMKKKNSVTMEVLQTMVAYKRVDLLVHPVVNEYVQLKWKYYGRFLYYPLQLLCLFNTILISTFAIYGSTPFLNATDSTSDNVTFSNESTSYADGQLQVSYFGQAIRWTALSSIVLSAILTLVALMRLKLNFLNIQFFFVFVTVVSSLVFLLCPNPFRYLEVGSVACFFSWLAFFCSLKSTFIIGIYVTIFFKILRRAFVVLFLSVLLIIAFAIPLYLLTKSMEEFSTFEVSLFTVFSYMLGEIQYESFIEKTTNSNSPLLIIIIIVLAIMMTIVMANLLIGLAVGDIEQSKLSAFYDGMVHSVDFYFKLDEALPKFLHQKVIKLFTHSENGKGQHDFHHRKIVGCQQCKVKKAWRKLLKIGQNALDSSSHVEERETSVTVAPPADVATEITQIKKNLKEIFEILHHAQADKDNCSDHYHNWRGRRFRWQMPESSSLSFTSSTSDSLEEFSDKTV